MKKQNSMNKQEQIKELVRQKYSEIALQDSLKKKRVVILNCCK